MRLHQKHHMPFIPAAFSMIINLILITAVGASENRVLMVGDSWAHIMFAQQVLDKTFAEQGLEQFKIKGDATAIGGTPAAFWNSPTGRQIISRQLRDNPTIDCIHLSTGGIEFIAGKNGLPGALMGRKEKILGWHTGLTREEEKNFYVTTLSNIQGVIDYCLAIRPEIKVVLCGYDYLNLTQTTDDPNSPCSQLWNNLGQPTPVQLNNGLIKLEKLKAQLAQDNPRVFHVNNLGLMQHHFGYPAGKIEPGVLALPGDPNYPSPTIALAGDGADCVHLSRQGYKNIADNCYDQAYQHIFTGSAALAPSSSKSTDGKDWLCFRGNAGLWGNAATKLGDSLSLRWTFKTDDAIISSAVIQGDRVFVGSTDSHLYCVNLQTGQKIWSFETGDMIEASPCIGTETVYIGSADGFLYALNISDGKLQWKFQTEDKIMGAANLFRPGPDAEPQILVGSYDSKLYCLSLAGKLLWSYETESFVNGTAAVDSGRITVGGCDAKIYVISALDGQLLHQIDVENYIAGSGALDGNQVFLGNYGEQFLCADVKAGTVLWTWQESRFPIVSSPALTPTSVLFGSGDKHLHCLDRKTGSSRWSFQTRGKVDSSPVICHNKVVFGSNDGRLYMIRLNDGELIWSYEIGRALLASPAIVNGWVVIGSEDGALYAFGT